MTRLLAATAAVGLMVGAFSGAMATGAPGHAHGHGLSTGADGGQPGKVADASRTVRLDMRDEGFNLKRIQVKPGETIRFVVTNKGKTRHEFALANAKEHEAHRKMMQQQPDMVHDEPNAITIEPGQTRELVWTFGRDPSFEFSCNIPGHAEQGMRGAFALQR